MWLREPVIGSFSSHNIADQKLANASSAYDEELIRSTPAFDPIPIKDRPQYVPHQVLVQFKDEANADARSELIQSLNAKSIKQFRNPVGLELLELPESMSVEQALDVLVDNDVVAIAEPNFIYYPSAIPNETAFSFQWGLNNTGQSGGVIDIDINGPEGWEDTVGSSDVVIAVIDTGVNYRHIDLSENIWTNPREIPGNGIDDDNNGWVDDIHGIDPVGLDSDPNDEDIIGHGTHVAGTIGAVGNNQIGIAGVMWRTKIISCRFLGPDGGTTSDAVQCMNYIAALKDAGVNIVATNNSWGSRESSLFLLNAIREHENRGILFIAAAGNDGINSDVLGNEHFPSSFDVDTIISVAAMDRHGNLAAFSNYGPIRVDIAAPGVDILGTVGNSRYNYLSGTSMAAPHVTGVIGLIHSNDPFISGLDAKALLLDSGLPSVNLEGKVLSGKFARINLPFVDSDLDGMKDRWELDFGFDPIDPADAALDADGDGLSNLEEFILNTNPRQADTDGDGLTDGDEINIYMTLPLFADSDGDGLSDGSEVNNHLTDPIIFDTDGDGIGDGAEINQFGTNPLNSDTDGDGMDDGFEIKNALNPNDAADGASDRDGDGLSNITEFNLGTDPNSIDSDGDGLTDAEEANVTGTDPTREDSDSDGMPDGWELEHQLDPLDATDGPLDADGDGISNLNEYRKGTDPNNVASVPTVSSWTGLQGSESHAGHVPIEPNVADFSLRWQKSLNTRKILGHIVIDSNKLFISSITDSSPQLSALRIADGEVEWNREFIDTAVVWSPAVFGQTVYAINSSLGGGARLFALDIDSGANIYSQPRETNNTDNYVVPSDGRVYLKTGNMLQSLDAATGNVVWEVALDSVFSRNDFTPAVSNQYVVVFVDSTLFVYDKDDGSPIFEISDTTCPRESNSRVLIDQNGNALAHFGDCIVKYDLASGQSMWEVRGVILGDSSVDADSVYVRVDGALLALDLSSGSERWRWNTADFISSNIISTLSYAFFSSQQTTYALDLVSHQVVWTYPAGGQLAISDEGALVIVSNGDQVVVINIEGDSDGDGLPNWWERHHRLDYTDASDANIDTDNDGLTNLQEFGIGTDPRNGDSDGDLLNDGDEVIRMTDPLNIDSDGDGLSDGLEVINYGTNPLLGDTDGDSISDGEEVNDFDTNPTDPNDLPPLLTSYHESFENGAPADWRLGSDLIAGWMVSSDDATDGVSSLKSTPIAELQIARAEWTAVFANGDLSFDARVVKDSCCDEIVFSVDGELVATIGSSAWSTETVPIAKGVHTLTWDFKRDTFQSNINEFGLLDNVNFVVPEPFASDPRNLLRTFDNKLSEFNRDGFRTRAAIDIPNALRAGDLVVTPNHKIAIFDPPLLHIFDPDKETFVTSEVVGWTAASDATEGGITVFDNHILATASFETLRFDLDGIHIDSVLIGRDYIDLTLGKDGFLYGLLNRNSLIDVIDPNSMTVLRTLQLDTGISRGIAVDSLGNFYSVDATQKLSYLNATGTTLESTFTPIGEWLHDADIADDGTIIFAGNRGGAGFASADFNSLSAIRASQSSRIQPSFVAVVSRDGLDADSDGIPDWWENYQGLDSTNPADALLDPDNDGLSNLREFEENTFVANSDTDQDGLSDGDEIVNSTDPRVADSDNDGLTDGEEVNTYATNPLVSDTDADGLIDGVEVIEVGSDPLVTDTDNDGIDDGWEYLNGLNPIDPSDAALDPDQDGLSNLSEFQLGTDHRLSDTDEDGLSDGDEVNIYLTDPKLSDTDADRLPDAWEVSNGLNPLSALDAMQDVDSDGFSNRQEYFSDSDPQDSFSIPLVEQWFTHQGNTSHTGFVPIRLDETNFQHFWTRDILANDTTALEQVAAGNGMVFVSLKSESSTQPFIALDAYNNTILWQKDFSPIFHVSPPAMFNGRVYLQTITVGSENYLWAFDQTSGAIAFQSPFAAQGPKLLAPTPSRGSIYAYNGLFGGMSSFNSVTGNINWSLDLPQYDKWAASVSNGDIFLYTGVSIATRGEFAVFDSQTGSSRFLINDPDFLWNGWSMNSAPVLDNRDRAFVGQGGRLLIFDLKRRVIRQELVGAYQDQPAWADGSIYVIEGNSLIALDDRDGTELWRWTAPDPLSQNIVVTVGHIFVASDLTTFAVDITSRSSVWSFAKGGQLSIGNDGIFYIAGTDGELSAIRTQLDVDNDRMDDNWEIRFGLSPADPTDGALDLDGDGLSNLEEFYLNTRPDLSDSDADGLSDSDEVGVHNTDPLVWDSDIDGLSDGDEVNIYGSDPLSVDSDDDGLPDQAEVSVHLTDPANPDSDGDSFSDGWEVFRGSDPGNSASLPGLVSELEDSFELDSVAVSQWVQAPGANASWDFDAYTASDGSRSLRSGVVQDNQTAAIEWTDNFDDVKLSFDAKVLAQFGDNLRFYVDGALQVVVDSSNVWETFSFNILSGVHTLRWEYAKNASITGLVDAAFIDNLQVTLLDSDRDGMFDDWERGFGLNPQDPSDASGDLDNDDLTNLDEFLLGTMPNNSDSDNDTMPDGWEVQFGLNPIGHDSGGDLDMDGLFNLDEYLRGTAPNRSDTDGDGMPDGWEVSMGFNPFAVFDALEDADGDLLSNVQEYQAGSNPFSSDSDNDTMPDLWEVQNSLNPALFDANEDADSDGMTNVQEYQQGTDPNNSDSDGDGMPDGFEFRNSLQLLVDDSGLDADNDGLTNLEEFQIGTNPSANDTDSDGMTDGWEVQFSLDPLSSIDAGQDADNDGWTNLQEFNARTNPLDPNSKPSSGTPPPSGGGGGGGGSTDPLWLLILVYCVYARANRRSQFTAAS